MTEEKERVLVVDDNLEICALLKETIESSEDFELKRIVHDGIMALEAVEKEDFDIIILDIAMPRLDGLGFLERLPEVIKGREKPTVIIFSAIGQDRVTLRAMELGADYFIIKPFDLDELLKRMTEIHFDKTEKAEENLNGDICDVLLELGFSANLRGYMYLREAVELVKEEESFLKSIGKGLYTKIAEDYDTTPSRVERAIRHAISAAWEKDANEKLQKMFDTEIKFKKVRPSNSELIALLADRMR